MGVSNTFFLKMGFGNESDEDLIVIEDGLKKNVLWVDECGSTMKLKM